MANEYNSNDITLIVGSKSIEDFFTDTTVSCDKDEDSTSRTYGLNGKSTINRINNNSYTCTFTITSNSEDNQFLRGLEASKTQFPLLYKNSATGEVTALSGCSFTKPAKKEDGKEIGGREWIVTGDGKEVL